jgi:UDP-N-acetylmuramoylalanine-D-glutamate ligase
MAEKLCPVCGGREWEEEQGPLDSEGDETLRIFCSECFWPWTIPGPHSVQEARAAYETRKALGIPATVISEALNAYRKAPDLPQEPRTP